VLEEFQDIFSDVPRVTVLGEHTIDLTSHEPIRSKTLMDPSGLLATTIGVAYGAVEGSMIPILSMESISLSTASRIEYVNG